METFLEDPELFLVSHDCADMRLSPDTGDTAPDGAAPIAPRVACLDIPGVFPAGERRLEDGVSLGGKGATG